MSSLGVMLPEGVHAQLALMSRMSLLPVVKVVVSVTACGPSFTQCASNPPGGSGLFVPVFEKRPVVPLPLPQSVGRGVLASLTMFPSSSKAPALPTSVSANALVRNGTAIASVIRDITIAACMYLFESIHFVPYEISPIVDNVYSRFAQNSRILVGAINCKANHCTAIHAGMVGIVQGTAGYREAECRFTERLKSVASFLSWVRQTCPDSRRDL